MNASERVPSRSGSAWKPGACMTVKLRHEVGQLVRVGADEQVAREQAVPGVLGDDADRQAVLRVGADEEVLDEQSSLPCSGRPACAGAGASNCFGIERLVDGAPPDVVARLDGSRTMNLSLGERPVNSPVSTDSGPWRASWPSPRLSASS